MLSSALCALFAIVAANPSELQLVNCVKDSGCIAKDYYGEWEVTAVDFQSICPTITYTITKTPLLFTEWCGQAYHKFKPPGTRLNGNFFSFTFNVETSMKNVPNFELGIIKVWKRNGKVVAAFVKQSLVHDFLTNNWPKFANGYTPSVQSTMWFKKDAVITETEKANLVKEHKFKPFQ